MHHNGARPPFILPAVRCCLLLLQVPEHLSANLINSSQLSIGDAVAVKACLPVSSCPWAFYLALPLVSSYLHECTCASQISSQ